MPNEAVLFYWTAQTNCDKFQNQREPIDKHVTYFEATIIHFGLRQQFCQCVGIKTGAERWK